MADLEELPCRDAECSGSAELERDGDHIYYECGECGFTFGFERIAVDAEDPTCAIGVPEDVRREFSAGMEQALEVKR